MLNINLISKVFEITEDSTEDLIIPALAHPNLTRGYSLEIWLRWSGENDAPIARFRANNMEYRLLVDANQRLNLVVEERLNPSEDTPDIVPESESHQFEPTIEPNQWVHLAFVLALKDVKSNNGKTPVWTPTLYGTVTLDGVQLPAAQFQTPALIQKPDGDLSLDLFAWDSISFRGKVATVFLWQGVATLDQIRLRRETLHTAPHRNKLFELYHNSEGQQLVKPEPGSEPEPEGALVTIGYKSQALNNDDLPILAGVDPTNRGGQQARLKASKLGNKIMQKAEQVANEQRQQAQKQLKEKRLSELREFIRQTNKANYDYIGFIESGRLKKIQGDEITDFFPNKTQFKIPPEFVGKETGICLIPSTDDVLVYIEDRVFVFKQGQFGPDPVTSWSEGAGNTIKSIRFAQESNNAVLVITFDKHITIRKLALEPSRRSYNSNGNRIGRVG